MRILLLALFPLLLSAQSGSKTQQIRKPFEYFVGSWSGHETGKAGIGKGNRHYEFIMDTTFLYHENRSHFEPQEKNPQGETHYDRGFYSYDQNRKTYILREFHSEGFVLYYVMDSTVSTAEKFVFVSEQSENSPPGLRARLTLEINNKNEFTETFELAFNGKDFSEWLKNYWTRKQ